LGALTRRVLARLRLRLLLLRFVVLRFSGMGLAPFFFRAHMRLMSARL
jgi:hypothetical protein